MQTSESNSNDSSTLDKTTDAAEQDDNQAAQENVSDSSTEATDAKDTVSEADWNPLDVVKKAVGDIKEATEGSKEESEQSDESSQSKSDSQKGAEKELGEITQQELDSYKPDTKRRIEAILDDKKRLAERVASLEPAAEQMENLQSFMEERKLTTDAVSELLVVGGLAMSEDPVDLRAALKRVNEFKHQIESQLGEVLPTDLQEQVDEGMLDAKAAKEVALSRIQNDRAAVKIKEAEAVVKTTVEERNKEQFEVARANMNSVMSTWQNQKIASDPDYQLKASLLQKEIKLRVIAEGGPVLNTNRALQIAEEAYAEVTKTVRALQPPKAPQAKSFLQSKANIQNHAAKPNSALEAARSALK